MVSEWATYDKTGDAIGYMRVCKLYLLVNYPGIETPNFCDVSVRVRRERRRVANGNRRGGVIEKEMRYWYKGTEIIRYEYVEWGMGDEITSVLRESDCSMIR